jgi:hypothetical protein
VIALSVQKYGYSSVASNWIIQGKRSVKLTSDLRLYQRC